MNTFSDSPERQGPPLSDSELNQLFDDIAWKLVQKGTEEVDRRSFTNIPERRTKRFYLDIPADLVQRAFYSQREELAALKGSNMTYITPHSMDREGVDDLWDSTYVELKSQVVGTNIVFTQGFSLDRDENSRYHNPRPQVDSEYTRFKLAVEQEEVIAALGSNYRLIRPTMRPINRDDAIKIRNMISQL